MNPIQDISTIQDNTTHEERLGKKTPMQNLDNKVKEYLSRADDIVNKNMDDVKKGAALTRLYRYICLENGGYADDVHDSIMKKEDRYVDFLKRWHLYTDDEEWKESEVLACFLKAAESAIKRKGGGLSIDGRYYKFSGWEWHPDSGIDAASVVLWTLLDAIYQYINYLKVQVILTTGKELPELNLSTRVQKDKKQDNNKKDKNNNPEYIELKRTAMRGLGLQLEEWYKDYRNHICHYDTERQINALCNMRKEVLELVHLIPENGRELEDVKRVYPGKDNDRYATFDGFDMMFIRGRKIPWEESPDEKRPSCFLALCALLYFFDAINYEIVRLKDIKAYDKPYEGSKETVGDDCMVNNDTSNTDTLLTTEGDEKTTLPSFGLSSKKQAHWGAVYTRLVGKGWLKKSEVTKLEFVYIMCAVGDKRFKQIKWHGATNALADIVRRKLQVDGVDRWEIAPLVFLDKNGKPLPPSFETTKSPCQNTQKVIDGIFDE